MINISFACFCLAAGFTVSFSLRTMDKRLDCNQPGLNNCTKKNCSENRIIVRNKEAPNGPDWDTEDVGVWMDEDGFVAVVNVTWKLKNDGGVSDLRGSEINILDQSTNQSMCVQFSFSDLKQMKDLWKFSLDGVVVEPGHSYTISVLNIPEPMIGDYRIKKEITIPRCFDKRIEKAQTCLQNGSLWDPTIITDVSVDMEHRKLFVSVSFEAAQYSERYRVSIQSPGLYNSKNVSKENTTFLNVTFELDLWQLSQYEIMAMIRPFFIGCKNNCRCPQKLINYRQYYPPRSHLMKAAVGLFVIGCFLAYFLWRTSHKDPVNKSFSAAREPPEDFKVQEKKRVLIVHSLDHPLYKDIVLKLCAFLATKCGTEVVLDLLDSTRLGVLGSIQWLAWQREQIENSSDKVLILCSRGVQAKWRAMCGAKQVILRGDACSSVGDTLSPALTLMVPHFIRTASFEKYIVAYFDEVCSEEDVPSPFNITVRYKLMKQFEELFFRILDTEKHEPGRVNHIKGLSENEYYQCPSGRALRDAIEAFHAYQQENPHWFEDELLEASQLEVEEDCDCDEANITTDLVMRCVPDSTQDTSHVRTEESDFTLNKTKLWVSEEFNPV